MRLRPGAQWVTARLGGFALEILSGLLLASVVQFLVDGLFVQYLIASLASGLYEGFVDPNGWSWADVGQRTIGIIAGLLAWSLLR